MRHNEPMELAFATRALRELCQQEGAAIEEFGADAAAELMARIADLRAATSVADIVAGRPTMSNGKDPRFTILVLDSIEIVIRPNHTRKPAQEGSSVDWQHVRRLRIDDLVRPSGGTE